MAPSSDKSTSTASSTSSKDILSKLESNATVKQTANKTTKPAKEKQEKTSSLNPISTDELANIVKNTLNKKFHKSLGSDVAYIVSDDDSPTSVDQWISTGSDILNLTFSNRKNGGLPMGKIVLIAGLEQSGKSLLCAHAVAEIQKVGGVAVYIDTESALSEEFCRAIGVDTSKMIYVQHEMIEDCLETIESSIISIRENNKECPILIVLDSIAQASTRTEMDAEHGKDGYATSKSIVLGKGMRKITNLIARQNVCLVMTNQLRDNPTANMPGQDKYTMPGGHAPKFAASLGVRLKKIGAIKIDVDGEKIPIGIKGMAEVFKNRLGPPLRKVEYEIYFNRGIDDTNTFLDLAVRYKIIKQSGAWYTWVNTETGEETKFQRKDFYEKVMRDKGSQDSHFEVLYNLIADRFIMKYKEGEHYEISDIAVDSSPEAVNDEF